jgi:predicted secreted protein
MGFSRLRQHGQRRGGSAFIQTEANEVKRNKRILMVCHCLLNSNAKIYPLAEVGGVYVDAVSSFLAEGAGIIQLPCPETCYLGANRWGMSKEQYDHQAFRSFCRTLLEPTMLQIQAFHHAGCTFIAVAGMDGSPNCGIEKTCVGLSGGDVCSHLFRQDPCRNLATVNGRGVFMEVLAELLHSARIDIPFLALYTETPSETNHSTRITSP